MNCDDVKDSLVEYLLDELNHNSRYAIAAHLREGCLGCNAFEQEILDGMDSLLAAIPEDPITPEQRSLILARATSETPNRHRIADSFPNSIHSLESSPWAERTPYILAFAAGITLMALLVPIRSISLSVGKAPEVEAGSQSNTFAVNPATIPADSEISVTRQAKTRFVSMERSTESSKVEGHIVWDTLNHEVHFFGFGIGTPPSGMRYVLWLTDQNKHPLATKELILDDEGRGKATVASTIFDVRYVFITLESKLVDTLRPSNNVQLSLDAVRFNLIKL